MSNITHGADFTLDGTWGQFNSVGEMWTAGQLINNASGFTYIANAIQQGTWAPRVAINGSTAGISQSLFHGNYQINGRTITANYKILLTSKGSNTGNVTITGLPFVDINDQTNSSGTSVPFYASMAGLTGAPIVNTQGGQSYMVMWQPTATGVGFITDANLTNVTQLQGTITYFFR
jgi:hypothetical protein